MKTTILRGGRAGGVVLLCGLILSAFAQAGATAPVSAAAGGTYRVVGATHTSSARKHDPLIHTGSSTSSWKLVAPTRDAPNLLSVTVTVTGPLVTGLGRVNIRGTFRAEATSNRPKHCTLQASTGTKKYPAVAPGPFSLAVAADPKSSKRVLVVQGPGFNVHASLANPYFESECSTSVSGEPDTDRVLIKSLPKSVFGQKVVVIRYAGATSEDGIAYRWSTTFTLKRVKSGTG